MLLFVLCILMIQVVHAVIVNVKQNYLWNEWIGDQKHPTIELHVVVQTMKY